MAGFGLLGHLAGGFAQAAEQDNRRKFEAEQQQRQTALGLTKILLENPAVPPEYKGQLVQYGMNVMQTPYGKKLPDFHKEVLSQLPAVQTPEKTQNAPIPQVQLGMPAQPPNPAALGGGGPAATGEAPSLTQSGSAAYGGAPPSLMPPPAPPGVVPGAGTGAATPGPVLPGSSQPVTLAPQQVAPAGQFHLMSQEEMMQRQSAAQLAHAKQISEATGVPMERVLGLQPKFATVPWGGGVYNQQTGEIDTPATAKPMGTPIKMKAEDGTYHLYQRFQDNSLRPIDNPQGMSVPLPTAELPTVTSSSTSRDLETGASSTKTVRQKVQPGTKGVAGGPALPPGVGKSVAAGAPGTTAGGQRTRTDMAADRLLMSDAIKASQSARTMVNLLDTQKQYMDTVAAGGAPTPRQDLSLIVAAVRAMNPGTVRLPQKELELELHAGSFGDRLRRQYDTATQGILPADQREDLFSVVDHETTNVAKDAAANWKQNMKGKALPPHLQRFGQQAGGGQSGLIPVTDPQGGVHYFKDQAAADQFKHLAGIQ